MALIPLMLDDYYQGHHGHHGHPMLGDIYDQNFGLGLDEVLHPKNSLFHVPLRSGYVRPWRHVPAVNSGVSNIHYGKDGFKVRLAKLKLY